MAGRVARFARFGPGRLPGHDYSEPGAYFITICSHERLLTFEAAEIAGVIQQTWNAIPLHFPNIDIDAFVIMPNHIHGVLIVSDPGVSVAPQHAVALRRPAALSAVVRSFKAAVTREVRALGILAGQRFWQPNYYDRVVRNDHELNRIREYIAYNPIAWQFDHENPQRQLDEDYIRRWAWLENDLTSATAP